LDKIEKGKRENEEEEVEGRGNLSGWKKMARGMAETGVLVWVKG